MGKTVNEIEQLESTLDKESITFKELKEGILKYKAKSEYQQAAIIIIRGVLEKRLHENSGLHKHSVKHRCLHCGKPIIFDNYSASWIHKRKWEGNDNGYYCDNNKSDIKFTATPNNGV